MSKAREVGSGMRNVYKYLPLYAKGATAEFVDGEMFRTILRFPGASLTNGLKKDTVKDTVKLLSKNEKLIFELIRDNPKITAEELSIKVGINIRNTKKK